MANSPAITIQDDWMHRFKKDCNFCHQLGNQITRTLWDIGGPQDFMHDEIATDKNNPVNAYGPIYAVSARHGTLNVVDPVTNDAWKIVIPTREDPQ